MGPMTVELHSHTKKLMDYTSESSASIELLAFPHSVMLSREKKKHFGPPQHASCKIIGMPVYSWVGQPITWNMRAI